VWAVKCRGPKAVNGSGPEASRGRLRAGLPVSGLGPRAAAVGALTLVRERGAEMFLGLFIVLLVAWLLGWAAFHIAGGLIHLLLIVAVISLIVHFVRGRPAY